MSKVRDWPDPNTPQGGFRVLLAATELERSWNGVLGIFRFDADKRWNA